MFAHSYSKLSRTCYGESTPYALQKSSVLRWLQKQDDDDDVSVRYTVELIRNTSADCLNCILSGLAYATNKGRCDVVCRAGCQVDRQAWSCHNPGPAAPVRRPGTVVRPLKTLTDGYCLACASMMKLQLMDTVWKRGCAWTCQSRCKLPTVSSTVPESPLPKQGLRVALYS